METLAVTNLFALIPDHLSQEWFQTLAVGGHYKIERIVSRGHRSAPGFWYDQDWDEWVLLLQGQAMLQFQPDLAEIKLSVGDNLLIPAGLKHRVAWTDSVGDTIWLAVHIARQADQFTSMAP
jgi:cupin 2 domain-containing protein